LIAKLYAVESEAREAQLDARARLQLRQERGVPAQLDTLTKRIIQIRQQAQPASLLAKPCISAQSIKTLLRFRYRWLG
jgi:hypothetical protein